VIETTRKWVIWHMPLQCLHLVWFHEGIIPVGPLQLGFNIIWVSPKISGARIPWLNYNGS
jgi:hypothetical protein